MIYDLDETQFLMHCLFQLIENANVQFVFAETHLKAKQKNMYSRLKQTNMIKDYFDYNYQDLPVFVAGDFNEEPQNEPIRDVMDVAFKDLYSLMQG